MHDLVLHNAQVVTPDGVRHGGVAVDDGRIVLVASEDELRRGRRRVDCEGALLLPGLIDPHIHFGGGDQLGDDAMVEDFRHDTRDCLIGGITTVSTTTVIGSDSLVGLYDRAVRAADSHSWCDFRVTSVVNNQSQVEEIPAVVGRSGVSFKFFPGYIGEQAEAFGMDPRGCTPDFFMRACEALRGSDGPAFPMIHAEEPYVRGILADRLRAAGRDDTLVAWAEASPGWAEGVQIYTYAMIAGEVGVPIYPVHVSSAQTVDVVASLQRAGFDVIAETLCCFLCTTAPELDEKGLGGKAKIQPPIRFDRDRERLWEGVRDGTITIVGTDSIPYSATFKEEPEFWDCRAGLNLQVADVLALMHDEGVNRGRIDIGRLVEVLSTNAAKVFGLYPRKGAIQPGADADLVVFDPTLEIELGVDRYRGRTDYSIWEGRKVRGAAVKTFLRGELVADRGEIVGGNPGGALAVA